MSSNTSNQLNQQAKEQQFSMRLDDLIQHMEGFKRQREECRKCYDTLLRDYPDRIKDVNQHYMNFEKTIREGLMATVMKSWGISFETLQNFLLSERGDFPFAAGFWKYLDQVAIFEVVSFQDFKNLLFKARQSRHARNTTTIGDAYVGLPGTRDFLIYDVVEASSKLPLRLLRKLFPRLDSNFQANIRKRIRADGNFALEAELLVTQDAYQGIKEAFEEMMSGLDTGSYCNGESTCNTYKDMAQLSPMGKKRRIE
ncbi:hypothetical protein PFICI_14333 [Pestalotiopsis fici W106-1]|uniref:Uncharacterized protein n=1 Tax=Pestalotiopsis fici (strain W106-1 / CGMCC3.15140) TaxID=1229662 RepID=W3WMT2_PESFW|nr:uncharacterized protein PFICI_14333 [Pestalotiopsis fici W106-1]ETS74467.1 hypothetical protein PFICI_14333 [Pestalotiopsis fici W106-1]